jgi:hypothetical protein
MVKNIGGTVVATLLLLALPGSLYAHAGNSDPNVVHACVNQGSNIVRIVGVNGSCTNAESALHWSIAGPAGLAGPAGPGGPAGPSGPQGPAGLAGWTGESVLIQEDHFDNTWYPNSLAPADWTTILAGGGNIPSPPPYGGVMILDTGGPGFGSVTLHGNRRASQSDGTLIFTTRIMDAYAETSGAVYGDAQPRGLANGADLANSLTFINAGGSGATLVTCRTRGAGVETNTTVDIGQWVRTPAVYQIVVKLTEATYYVNGVLMCIHASNLPTVPLNMYFSTSDGGAGFVPHTFDWARFERVAP